MTLITDQRVLITGASSGIGRATAIRLAAEGASVALVARRIERLNQLVSEIQAAGGTAHAIQADVTDAVQVRTMADDVNAVFGGLDVLVNNVGVSKYGPLSSLDVDDYDWMMDSNMKSSFLCTNAFLPGMLEQGSGQICFVGSVAGLKGLPGETVYCATKFAQMGFAQALDYETREHGIKVSVVAPGGVNTEFAIGTGRTAGDPALDAMLDPEDVADAILFALTQPEKSRSFLIGLRPMSEPL